MTEMLEHSNEQSPLLDAINELREREDILSEERSLLRLRERQVAPGSVHEIVDFRRGKIATTMIATPDNTLHKPLVKEVVQAPQPATRIKSTYHYGRY